MTPSKITLFYVLSLLGLLGGGLLAIALYFSSGYGPMIAKYILTVVFPISALILFIDRWAIKKYKIKKINNVEGYILLGAVLTFLLVLVAN